MIRSIFFQIPAIISFIHIYRSAARWRAIDQRCFVEVSTPRPHWMTRAKCSLWCENRVATPNHLLPKSLTIDLSVYHGRIVNMHCCERVRCKVAPQSCRHSPISASTRSRFSNALSSRQSVRQHCLRHSPHMSHHLPLQPAMFRHLYCIQIHRTRV
jgi:hypothetical protein